MNLRSTRNDFRDDDSVSVDLSSTETNTESDPQFKPDERDETKEVQRLASSETAHIRFWRLVVVALLLVSGAVLSTFTYVFLNGEEKDDYVDAYFLFANTIRDITRFRAENMFEAFQSLGESITAHAIDQNLTFPFVSLPMFEVAGRHALSQSRTEIVFYTPFVTGDEKEAWERYAWENQGWLEESRKIRLDSDKTLQGTSFIEATIPSQIFESTTETAANVDISPPGRDFYSPIWQSSPVPFFPSLQNFNLRSFENTEFVMKTMRLLKDSVMSWVEDASLISGSVWNEKDHDAFHAQFVTGSPDESTSLRPHATIYNPVHEQLGNRDSEIVGFVTGVIAFDAYLADLLPDTVRGIYSVLRNTCGQQFSYELTGNRAVYLGDGDRHETAFNQYEVVVPFDAYRDPELAANTDGHCRYSLHIYPSQQFAQGYKSSLPIVFTSLVAATFFLMALTFLVYDRFVHRRNIKVVNAAARSNAIVSSLFPSNVRDRLFEDAKARSDVNQAAHSRLKTFLHNGDSSDTAITDENAHHSDFFKTKPIAELFPHTTIMFADISGFTAWSSSREPAQVFQLLETLYHSFDETAKKRRVFKVETVGDCYVAVAGLPDPRKDHAVVMARFAKDCMHQMHSLTRKLEVSLGPDTADLSLRIGLHSGPVTAGVLRGERSRFQLFGDTMNTAARMESNGIRGRIQISQETSDLLADAGKTQWFVAREDTIVAKGKGELNTFWLSVGDVGKGRSTTDTTHSSDDVFAPNNYNSSVALDGLMTTSAESDQQVYNLVSNKTSRLIDWNVDVLSRLIKQIVARRKASKVPKKDLSKQYFCPGDNRGAGTTVLDEVTEILALPEFDADAARRQQDPENIELDDSITSQLQQYVSNVSAMYRNNPFHNFEHASHVTMSVVKLLSRIVAPVDVVVSDGKNQKRSFASKLHDHTYGITSDPLTQFACVFSALIHDVDHSGVPNAQLVKENSKIATFYQGKSVAEQNSVDLAWDLLLDDSFKDLRAAIFATDVEKARFRQLVVNSVMATDIMDPDLKAIRNARWEKAFSAFPNMQEDLKDVTNRKATIVIEHLIQASDVAHTMQHWHIYRKWNERLFLELYQAYIAGRAEKSPETFWYKGELGFFDFYIIPLAMKLKECGVFGVSSDEYLNYAMRNRKEWEDRGQEVVREMMEKIKGGT